MTFRLRTTIRNTPDRHYSTVKTLGGAQVLIFRTLSGVTVSACSISCPTVAAKIFTGAIRPSFIGARIWQMSCRILDTKHRASTGILLARPQRPPSLHFTDRAILGLGEDGCAPADSHREPRMWPRWTTWFSIPAWPLIVRPSETGTSRRGPPDGFFAAISGLWLDSTASARQLNHSPNTCAANSRERRLKCFRIACRGLGGPCRFHPCPQNRGQSPISPERADIMLTLP
jgi:hypothetical protein